MATLQTSATSRDKSDTHGTNDPDGNPRPPVVGVLTRNLIRSPVVSWIIPARIRHRDRNDVLFIHHNWIEVKELSRDGHLYDVTFKADFGSTIRSARVLGAVRKPAVPAEESDDEDFIDTIIKQEEPEPMEITSESSQEIPPQMLVLALESKILVFMFAIQHSSENVRFISYQRPLPATTQYPDQLGKHIAVDPK